MERNKKYNSQYLSSEQLETRRLPVLSLYSNDESRKIQRKNHNKSFSVIKISEKQNNPVPFQNEYSFINKRNNLDQLAGIENYFKNLYTLKKQRRYEKILEMERREKLILPSIYQKQNDKLTFENQLLKMKLQFLNMQMNKMSMDYSRLPLINQKCHCSPIICYPPQFGYPMNNPSYPPQPQPQTQTKPNQQISPADKARRKKLVRKFRICGIAVYFMTLFPHYSYLFGHFKLKEFLEKYLVEENRMIRSINESLIEKFKEIPLYEEIRMIHDKYDQENKLQEGKKTKNEDPKIKISNEGSSQTYIVNLQIFKRVVLMIIQVFDGMVETFKDEIYEFFSIGSLNSSYYGDETFAIEEMPFVYCHPDKNNIQVTNNQERALLLSSFIIKKIVYQYLVRMAVDSEWHQDLASFSSLKKKEAGFLKLICKELQLSAFFLYELSIKNFYNLIESQQPGNFLQQSDSSMPLPVKTMRFPSLFMSSSEKQLFSHGLNMFSNRILNMKNDSDKKGKTAKKGNKKTGKSETNFNWNEQEEEILEQYKLLIQEDPLNLIHNNFQFAQLSKIIGQYMKQSYDKAEKSLMGIVEKLRRKVLENRKMNYRRIHEEVMKKKYILTKEHEILQGVIFLRTNEERKLVSSTRKMLQIYMDVLAENEIEGEESELVTKREIIQKKNTAILTNRNLKSRISLVSGTEENESKKSSVQSQEQTSQSSSVPSSQFSSESSKASIQKRVKKRK